MHVQFVIDVEISFLLKKMSIYQMKFISWLDGAYGQHLKLTDLHTL